MRAVFKKSVLIACVALYGVLFACLILASYAAFGIVGALASAAVVFVAELVAEHFGAGLLQSVK